MKFLFLLLLSSCATAPTGGLFGDRSGNLEGKVFKKDLVMEVNGLKAIGIIVVPRKSSYKIEVHLRDKAELIKLTSCHREIIAEKSGFRNRKNHTFKFKAEVGLENEDICQIHIGAYDVQGQHAWGLIDIRNETLFATLQCNGKRSNEVGVSLCQTREGLNQRITFQNEVSVYSSCGDIFEDGRQFDIYAKVGTCTYVFRSEIDQFHRLTVFGYNDTLLHVIKARNQ